MTASTELMWTELSRANALNPAQRHRWRLVLSELKRYVSPSSRPVVIDLGCGSGELLRRVRQVHAQARVIGFDVETRALEIARRKVPAGEFLQADLCQSEAATEELAGAADVVLCSEVLEHLQAPSHTAALAFRLLRPGGAFIVTVPSGRMTALDKAIGHVRHFDLASAEQLLRDAGFALQRSYLWGFPFHTAFRIAVGMARGVPAQCTDANFSKGMTAAFAVLDGLFHLNAKSRHVGRQVVIAAIRPVAA